jgi:16S rRNA (guanine527-N7)-methyltransferase
MGIPWDPPLGMRPPVGPDHGIGAAPSNLLGVLEEARSLGFLGAWDLQEQMAHALGFAHAIEEALADLPGGHCEFGRSAGQSRWMDMGSGGGLPGLVLARRWDGSSAVLLDSAERRTTFLSRAVGQLGWEERVQVVRARAEDAGRLPDLRGGFDVVVARSFGSPPVTAECAAPFLRPGGLLVVSEPPSSGAASGRGTSPPSAARWPREGLATLGMEPLIAVRSSFGYQVVRQVGTCPQRFPRRAGVATKRPLYRVAEG